MNELFLRNRQRVRGINLPLLRRISTTLLEEFAGVTQYELCFHFVAAPEMTRINRQFLKHEGSTDVITFDHAEPGGSAAPRLLNGEIYICLEDAVTHARRFRTSWQSEVVRCAIHGVLHLLGHDDTTPAARRRMKREENRLLRRAGRRFSLAQLTRAVKLRA